MTSQGNIMRRQDKTRRDNHKQIMKIHDNAIQHKWAHGGTVQDNTRHGKHNAMQ